MNNNRFTIDLNNLDLKPTQRKKIHAAMQAAIAAELDAIETGVVTVSALFENSGGALIATHIRGGISIGDGAINQSGSISLRVGQPDDIISISGSSEGTVKVVINTKTRRTTPVNFVAGRFAEGFRLI